MDKTKVDNIKQIIKVRCKIVFENLRCIKYKNWLSQWNKYKKIKGHAQDIWF